LLKLGDYFMLRVGPEKCGGKWQPLPGWQCSNQIQQKHQQIVCLPRCRRQGLFVVDLKIDQARTICFRFVDYVCHAGITVRPAAPEFVAPKLMGPMQFHRRGPQHPPRQRATINVFPKTFARNFIEDDGARTRLTRFKVVAIEHFEAIDLPSLPVFNFAPEPNRNSGDAKIEICEFGELFTVNVSALSDDGALSTGFLGDGIDGDGFNQFCGDRR
jgi:hypothetical protein